MSSIISSTNPSDDEAEDADAPDIEQIVPCHQPSPVQEDEVKVLALPPAKKKDPKNWPQNARLIRDQPEVVAKLFNAAMEHQVWLEVKANDKGNVKGNKWAKFHDHLWGGGTERGLMYGVLPQIPKCSKLKAKMITLWETCSNMSTADDNNLDGCPVDIKRMAVDLLGKYNKNKDDEATQAAKSKERDAILQEQMKNYENSRGALPPGVKGIEGGGKGEHSTNLTVREPATYGYVNATTGDVEGTTGVVYQTPKATKGEKKKNRNSSGGSTSVHNHAMSGLNKLSSTLESMMNKLNNNDSASTKTSRTSEVASDLTDSTNAKKEAKRRKISHKLDNLRTNIKFYTEMGPDDPIFKDELANSKREYIKLSKQLNDLDDLDE